MSTPFFAPIEPNADRWPITKLHRDQSIFLKEVIDKSLRALCLRYATDEDLYRMLMQTTNRELTRIASDPWPCDPKDDHSFWETMAKAIEHKVDAYKLLQELVERYVEEMRSRFAVWHYKLIAGSVHHTINLFKCQWFKFVMQACYWPNGCKRLQEKFHVTGAVDMIRALAKQGTLVLLPTHTSNWDSLMLGLVMRQIGLPPLSWGTGLNLFNNPWFRFIFSKLGTYKIDRRKKTIPYLQIQKYYTCVTLEWGCHTLFYPSGTRSRSGAIENTLKLGLLDMPFEAQRNNFQRYGVGATKLFLVPIVLNYHCVSEAPQLIREFAQLDNVMLAGERENGCVKSFLLDRNMLLEGTEIFIHIGSPLDVMGNTVDMAGRSWNGQGEEVDLLKVFSRSSKETKRPFVKHLSHSIAAAYYRINTVLSSHFVAFVAYELAQTMEGFSIYLEQMVLRRDAFIAAMDKMYQAFSLLYQQNKINFTPLLRKGPLLSILTDGIAKLGIYHTKPPLIMASNGDVIIQNVLTLWYYHNRLTGYGLEKESNCC